MDRSGKTNMAQEYPRPIQWMDRSGKTNMAKNIPDSYNGWIGVAKQIWPRISQTHTMDRSGKTHMPWKLCLRIATKYFATEYSFIIDHRK